MSERSFDRFLLRQLAHDIKDAGLGHIRVNKDAWVHVSGRGSDGYGTYEFHTVANTERGIKEFYWYGAAYSKWEARYNGWVSYLTKFHQEVEL